MVFIIAIFKQKCLKNLWFSMHLGNLLLSLYHAAKTKRWQNLKFWKSSNKIFLKVDMGQMGR